MRIVHTVRDYRRNGGVGTYLDTLVQHQRNSGHEVVVLCEEGDGRLAMRELPDVHVDVVHAHDYWRSTQPIDAPLVQSLHNYDFSCSSRVRYLGSGSPCERAHGAGCIANWPRCSHSVRVDQRVADFKATTANLAAVLAAAAVIAYSTFVQRVALVNGVDSRRLRRIPLPAERIPNDPSYRSAIPGRAVFVGRLSKPKGVNDLVRAIGLTSTASLVVVGDGYLRADLERLAAKVAPGRVSFAGWASGKELAAHYSRASVIVMPGRWPEPFGLVGLEAAWAGRPIVASRTGGVTDWLHEEVTGLGVDPGKPVDLAAAIARVLDDPSSAKRMGQAARRRAEAWPDFEAHSLALDKVYAGAGA